MEFHKKLVIVGIWFGLILTTGHASSFEYIYPILASKQEDKTLIYLIYQKNVAHLELWLWDPKTTRAHRALLSTYTPAGVELWPEDNGFSFIDNGRIRLKSFTSSQLKTIALSRPVYELSLLYWIDDENFYFSAKQGDHFGLFCSNIDGRVIPLQVDDNSDIMYPQKKGDNIFYIRRYVYGDGYYCYSIWRTLLSNRDSCFQIYSHGSNPIIFLHMTSESEGYFIELPATIYSDHSLLSCAYYRFQCKEGIWSSEKLFDFSLPTILLFSHHNETVLHETILRLIPHHYKETIYYCDSSTLTCMRRRASSLDIYVYDRLTGIRQRITQAQQGQFFFAPFITDGILYCGGVLCEEDQQQFPIMRMNEEGEVCFELPKFYFDEERQK